VGGEDDGGQVTGGGKAGGWLPQGEAGNPSAESFTQFMERISAQIESGAIPAICHEEVCQIYIYIYTYI
jgi:hypothetical protein